MSNYVIWNRQQQRWCTRDNKGSPRLTDAARYSEAEAGKIVLNQHVPNELVGMTEEVAPHWVRSY